MNIIVSNNPLNVQVSEVGIQGPAGSSGPSSSNLELTGTLLQTGKLNIPSGSGIFHYSFPDFKYIYGSDPQVSNSISYANSGAWRIINMIWDFSTLSIEGSSFMKFQIRYENTANYVDVGLFGINEGFNLDLFLPVQIFVPPNCNFRFIDNNSSAFEPQYLGPSQVITLPL